MTGIRPRFDQRLVDGVVAVRPFEVADQPILIAGRDDEFHRFMGEGSSDPTQTACITIRTGPRHAGSSARHDEERIVGWVDADDDRSWLGERELNVGYGVFAPFRGNAYAATALSLFARYLAAQTPPFVPTLLIDPGRRWVSDSAFPRRGPDVGDKIDAPNDKEDVRWTSRRCSDRRVRRWRRFVPIRPSPMPS